MSVNDHAQGAMRSVRTCAPTHVCVHHTAAAAIYNSKPFLLHVHVNVHVYSIATHSIDELNTPVF